MTIRHDNRVDATGGIYEISLPSAPRYLGSCAALGFPTHFITAGHCVAGHSADRLAINHSGCRDEPFSRVRSCCVLDERDLAVLETDVEEPTWIRPFRAVVQAESWGEPVTAVGRPVGILSEAQEDALRVFRGFIQRAFLYTGRAGHTYPAYELSFPAPPGLSGGPLFADDDPTLLLGVVTENFKSYTIVDSEDTVEVDGSMKRVESREVVTYGVAVNAFYGLAFLENAIPAGNLFAGKRTIDSG